MKAGCMMSSFRRRYRRHYFIVVTLLSLSFFSSSSSSSSSLFSHNPECKIDLLFVSCYNHRCCNQRSICWWWSGWSGVHLLWHQSWNWNLSKTGQLLNDSCNWRYISFNRGTIFSFSFSLWIQVIQASEVSPGVITFGYSLAGNLDVDNNGYPGRLIME